MRLTVRFKKGGRLWTQRTGIEWIHRSFDSSATLFDLIDVQSDYGRPRRARSTNCDRQPAEGRFAEPRMDRHVWVRQIRGCDQDDGSLLSVRHRLRTDRVDTVRMKLDKKKDSKLERKVDGKQFAASQRLLSNHIQIVCVCECVCSDRRRQMIENWKCYILLDLNCKES